MVQVADRKALPHQVRDGILDLLRRGGYRPGDRIPSEPELTSLLRVSRPTLREALRMLELQHVLRPKRGSGTYLLRLPKNIDLEITQVNSVTDWLDQRGIRGDIKVLSARQVPANERIAEGLALAPGDPVIAVERIRYAEGMPVIYSIDVVPARLAKTPWSPTDFESSLLIFLERQWGLYVDHAQSTIQAVSLDDRLADRIGVAAGSPWIYLEQINFDPSGERVIYSMDYHRGEAIVFHVTRYRG